MSEWHEERYHARQEALAEASHDCETEKEELEAENLALDDELKQTKSAYLKSVETIHELKATLRLCANELLRLKRHYDILQTSHDTKQQIIEDLRAKLLELDELIAHYRSKKEVLD